MGRHTAYNHGNNDNDDVENVIAVDRGSIEGDVTQVGHLGYDSDDETPQGGGQVKNTITGGSVTGTVIQAGNVQGPINLDR